jgi:hypothetical protein
MPTVSPPFGFLLCRFFFPLQDVGRRATWPCLNGGDVGLRNESRRRSAAHTTEGDSKQMDIRSVSSAWTSEDEGDGEVGVLLLWPG